MEAKKDNAAQKIVRLLKKLNDELIEPGSGEMIMVQTHPTGGGGIRYMAENHESSTIFNFKNYEELLNYLEASPLKRLLLSIDNALPF